MIELIFILVAFIVTFPVRIVCLLWLIVTFPFWIWLSETRTPCGLLLWRLIYDCELRKESENE